MTSTIKWPQHNEDAESLPPIQDEREPNPFSTENPAPPPIDPAMEQQAYADLLAFAAQYDEGDADTIIEALNMDEFLEEDFEPGLADLDSLDILEG